MTIVESHHLVLEAWARVRARLGQAPRVLSFDHHTDTSPAFRNQFRKTGIANEAQSKFRKQWLSEVNVHEPESIKTLIQRLSNDEHISAAIGADLISSALVIAHNAVDTDLAVFREHRMICQAVDSSGGTAKVTLQDCNQALESEFIQPRLNRMNDLLQEAGEPGIFEYPFILDFDLDYFTTWQSARPTDASLIQNLARKAVHITVATEPEYVNHCRKDPDLNSEGLLPLLLKTLDHVGNAASIIS